MVLKCLVFLCSIISYAVTSHHCLALLSPISAHYSSLIWVLSQIFWLGLRIIAGDTMVSISIYSRKECCWGQAKEREIFQIYQNKVKFLDLKGHIVVKLTEYIDLFTDTTAISG